MLCLFTLTTTPLGITDIFIVSMALSFVECYVVEIMQFVVVSYWLLLLVKCS